MATANPDRLKSVKQHNTRQIFFSAARVPSSHRLFVGASDFAVHEVDLAAAKLELKAIGKHESYVTGVVLAGKTVISGGYDGKLTWWDVERKQAIRTIEAHGKWVRNLAISPNGKFVASVADDMICKVWEPASGKVLHELRGHKEKTPNHFPSMLFACAFSTDSKYLATGDKVGHIVVWEAATGKQVATVESPGMYTWDGRQRIHSIGGIRSLAFSPDGKYLAVGGIGRIGNVDHLDGPARIEVFDWQSGKATHLFDRTKFKGLVNRLAFHPQGDWLLAAGGAGDGFLVFLDLNQKKVIKDEKVRFHVHAVVTNENADTLYLAGHNGLAMYELKG